MFLVTFVTTDKSNPKRSGGTKTACTVYPQRNNVQVKIYAVSFGEVSGRLKRRPYGFCFYVVPLRLNGNRNLHPSAPLGLLLSIVTKVTKKTLLRLRRKKESK